VAGGTDTFRHDAWTEFELQCLYDVVNDLHWYDEAAPKIFRSENAIRIKMSAIRREFGIIPCPFGAKSKSTASIEIERAAAGSEKLRRAIRELEAA
jgi:hypothetical protein